MPLIGVSQCDTTYNHNVKRSITKEQAPRIHGSRSPAPRFYPNEYNRWYNRNDELWQDGCFKNSRLWDGRVYEYDVDGKLEKIKVFKNGFYHSDEQLPE
jgi:antitoxin component YwqK of YwqJK toxin-antitoxin module